jgi:hypothetical protein
MRGLAPPCGAGRVARSLIGPNRGEVLSKLAVTIAAAVAALGVPGVVDAAPPKLLSVGHQNRHPTATFSAPGADFATIYLATSPARGTDGRFLDENIKEVDFLTMDEIQGGAWLDSSQVDPGVYYVMLNATDFCFPDDDCTDGFSEVLTLQVPKPTSSYRGQVGPIYRFLREVTLKLTVRPLGERLPYRVCWRLRSKARRCVSGVVVGYSWNSAATDSLSVRMRGMARSTTFTWYAKKRAVATKTART